MGVSSELYRHYLLDEEGHGPGHTLPICPAVRAQVGRVAARW